MSLLVVGSELVPLARWVYVVVKASEECVREPLLAKLSCRDGPVADDIQDKIAALLRGEPGQTVAIVVEEQTDAPFAVASVYLDGHPRRSGFPGVYTKQIAENPYIHLLVGDDRYRKRTLLDEQTLLGSVALRAVLEVIERDEPNAPHQYAFVDPENSDAQQAFQRSRFEPRDPKVPPDRERSRDLLFVRDSGELPPAPEGYPSVLPSYRP